MFRRLEARYPAVLEPEEGGGFFVRFVDLENTYTDGLTLDEALFDGAEVLSAMLGWMLDENKPIPDPSPAGEGLYLIAPDARTQAALPIRRARGERSLAERARSLQTSWPSAQRLENPRHSPPCANWKKRRRPWASGWCWRWSDAGGTRFNWVEFHRIGIALAAPLAPSGERTPGERTEHKTAIEMHWERGYRGHGLWTDDGARRLARVAIGPRGWWKMGRDPYSWETRDGICGEAMTLEAAKRAATIALLGAEKGM